MVSIAPVRTLPTRRASSEVSLVTDGFSAPASKIEGSISPVVTNITATLSLLGRSIAYFVLSREVRKFA